MEQLTFCCQIPRGLIIELMQVHGSYCTPRHYFIKSLLHSGLLSAPVTGVEMAIPQIWTACCAQLQSHCAMPPWIPRESMMKLRHLHHSISHAELPWDPVLRKSILPCVAGVLAPSLLP